MILKTIVEHDESGFQMIIDSVSKLNEDRFIAAIRNMQHSPYDVTQNTELIKMCQHRLNIESNAVSQFAINYVESFPTDNNKCFTTAQLLFNRIRSTLCYIKNAFRKTTSPDYRQLPAGVPVPTVFEKSPLGNEVYDIDAFGIESLPDYYKEFFHALETMFSSCISTLALCELIIQREEAMRNNPVELKRIYDECCRDIGASFKDMFVGAHFDNEPPANPLEDLRLECKSDESYEFLRKGYHKYNKSCMRQYVAIKMIREGRNGGLTDIEAIFFGKQRARGLMARRVIEQFDLVNGVEGQSGKLDSLVIVEFLKWCHVPESMEKRLYKEYFIPNYLAKGKYKPLGWSAVWERRKLLKFIGVTDETLADNFKCRMAHLFTQEEFEAVHKAEYKKIA